MNSAAEFLLFLGLNSAISACIWWLLQDVLSPRARVTRAGSRFSCGTHLFQISRDCVQAQGLWKSALPFLFVGGMRRGRRSRASSDPLPAGEGDDEQVPRGLLRTMEQLFERFTAALPNPSTDYTVERARRHGAYIFFQGSYGVRSRRLDYSYG
ncbi:hypothetical protein RchiOBHm_Chr3g0467771 [Rosa chinensis]|uniref:Uncharacterized protein n=1 Tax=Rosa chinensis TaxID=74649 RepID=A0A2P6RAD2_ROSCH|nr:hypothetical protein RchiOBHm_Chr3g0467771 [Rosa chinensis]